MSSKWERSRRAIFDAAVNPLVFFSAAFAFGISVNLVSNFVASYLPEENASVLSLIIGLGLLAILLMVILAPKVARWWIGVEKITPGFRRPARRYKWLIVLASPEPGIRTAEHAVKYHAPVLEKVWLLCSRGKPPSSEQAARDMIRRVEQERADRSFEIELVPLSEAEFKDPEVVRTKIEEIYGKIPEHLTVGDVVIDITGGTKTTTAGAFIAGLPRGRRLEITPPDEGGVDESGRGFKPGDPVEILIDYSLKRARR